MNLNSFSNRFRIQLSRLNLNIISSINHWPEWNDQLVKIKSKRRHNSDIDLIFNNFWIYVAKQEADAKHSEIENVAFGSYFVEEVV